MKSLTSLLVLFIFACEYKPQELILFKDQTQVADTLSQQYLNSVLLSAMDSFPEIVNDSTYYY